MEGKRRERVGNRERGKGMEERRKRGGKGR